MRPFSLSSSFAITSGTRGFLRRVSFPKVILGITSLVLPSATAQDPNVKFNIQPPKGRPGFMVKVEMSNCKHDAAKAEPSARDDAFIACMEKLGYKVTMEQTGNAAPTPTVAAGSTDAATLADGHGKVDYLADGSATYTYKGTVDIGGLRVGMSAAEARQVLHGEKLTNYEELTLTLKAGRPTEDAHNFLRGSDAPIEVPNSEFLNAIVTDNRPPIKLDHAKYVYADGKVDPNSRNETHSFYDDVDGKIEIFEAEFSPNRGQEVVVAMSHSVSYDWTGKHKGMLLQDFAKGFATKYNVQVPDGVDSNGSQVAIWNVSSPDHTLLQANHYFAPGKFGCNPPTLPSHVSPGPYDKVRIGGNYAMVSTQRGGLGRYANTCGAEVLYLKWTVGNPSEPADRQIVTSYIVAVLAPTLELAGTNKAFAVIQDAVSKNTSDETKKAADEGKKNKNPF